VQEPELVPVQALELVRAPEPELELELELEWAPARVRVLVPEPEPEPELAPPRVQGPVPVSLEAPERGPALGQVRVPELGRMWEQVPERPRAAGCRSRTLDQESTRWRRCSRLHHSRR
jgi:hypothetical protein